MNAPANRTHEHCRAWVEAGHEVHVVTCVPSHPAGKPFAGYRMGWYQRETTDGIHIHRVWTYLAANRGVARRVANFLSFVPTAVLRALRLGRFDVVIGTSPQFFCAMAAGIVASLRRTPWVFELRDLWPESIPAVGAIGPSRALHLLEKLELHLYRKAAAVVCVTEAFIENLRRRGIDPGKLHFVPNGIVPAAWEGGARDECRARFGLAPDDIAVSYIGTLGMAHGLGTTLEAAHRLRGTNARFLIIGDGAERAALEARAKAKRLSNVTFTGLLPREAIAHLMAATDIALVTLKPSETFKTVLPSKMFEAMAAKKPIVLAVDGEARRVLERSGGGVAVPPGDPDALADAVRALAAEPARREWLGASGRAFVRREFDRAAWAARYLDILHALVNPEPQEVGRRALAAAGRKQA